MLMLKQAVIDSSFRPLKLDELEDAVSKIKTRSEEIAEKYGIAAQTPNKKDSAKLYNVISGFKENSDWSSLDPRDQRRVPYSIAGSEDERRSEVMLAFLSNYGPNVKLPRYIAKSLFNVYLMSLEKGRFSSKAYDRVLHCLTFSYKNLPKRWIKRIEKWDLLNHTKAIAGLSQHLLSHEELNLAISELDIPIAYLHGSLFTDVFKKFLEEKRQVWAVIYPDIEEIKKLINFFASHNLMKLKPNIIATSLEPWQENTPDQSTQNYLLNKSIEYIGDPRIKKTRWTNPVLIDVKKIIVEWLVGRDIDLFINIVRKTSSENTVANRQWQYREKFWKGLHALKYIKNTQLYLGPLGNAVAKNLDIDKIELAKLKRGSQNQCVLLMKVKNESIWSQKEITIAEWNTNGKCRIWKDGNLDAPELSHISNDATSLRHNADHEQVHHGATYGLWQRKLRDKIANYLEIRSHKLGNFYEL